MSILVISFPAVTFFMVIEACLAKLCRGFPMLILTQLEMSVKNRSIFSQFAFSWANCSIPCFKTSRTSEWVLCSALKLSISRRVCFNCLLFSNNLSLLKSDLLIRSSCWALIISILLSQALALSALNVEEEVFEEILSIIDIILPGGTFSTTGSLRTPFRLFSNPSEVAMRAFTCS